MSVDPFAHERFLPHVGSTFRIEVAGGTVELLLAQVGELRSSSRAESFALEFSGRADQPLAQGEHLLEHDALGEIVLFIVPVAGDHEHRGYEAVINRLREP